MTLAACLFGWWLMAGAGLFREKNTVGWWLISVTPAFSAINKSPNKSNHLINHTYFQN
jgi:hypothetical protein